MSQDQPKQAMAPRKSLVDERRSATGKTREPIREQLAPKDNEPPHPTDNEADYRPRAAHREGDPIVAYLLLVSLAIGISPLEPSARYILLLTLMGGLGTMAYLLGGIQSIRNTSLDDLIWGVIYGFFASFPFLIVFGDQLATISRRMFDAPDTPALVMDTWVFMVVVFVLPYSESLFFRGAMQGVRSLFLTAALATIWSSILFFPHMELSGREAIGAIMLVVFSLLNFLYSYVGQRNSLAAASVTQIISYSILWFVPRILF